MSDQARGSTYNNVNSRIAVQGGNLHGDAYFQEGGAETQTARGLRQQVEEVRRDLAEARRAGLIDRGTFVETDAALDEAHRTADDADEADRGAFLRALRKAKGLVEEVAELAGPIAAIIAAARQLA